MAMGQAEKNLRFILFKFVLACILQIKIWALTNQNLFSEPKAVNEILLIF